MLSFRDAKVPLGARFPLSSQLDEIHMQLFKECAISIYV